MVLPNLFSRRKRIQNGTTPDVYKYNDIPIKFRVQITHIWMEIIGQDEQGYELYHTIVKMLRKEYGVYVLHKSNNRSESKYHSMDELIKFFLETTNLDEQLDTIEITFRAIDNLVSRHDFRYDNMSERKANNAIDELNQRAREHGVGYQYTDGEIIRVDSQIIHKEAVVPALSVLRKPEFKNAQTEFLAAHEHYRHGRKAEALVDCLKSFESTMKIICDRRKWQYDKNKGASELVRVCMDNGLVPSYWQNHFSGLKSVLTSGIPTPRNKQAGHGGGSQPPQTPPDELVAYVLHMTASTILYLSEADAAMP